MQITAITTNILPLLRMASAISTSVVVCANTGRVKANRDISVTKMRFIIFLIKNQIAKLPKELVFIINLKEF